MNIFFLDRDPEICAAYHIDKHVIKMVTEYAQILGTAIRLRHGEVGQIYKKVRGQYKSIQYKYCLPSDSKVQSPNDQRDVPLATHPGHPSVKWAMESDLNMIWLFNLYEALAREYTYRYCIFRGKSPRDHGAWKNYNEGIRQYLPSSDVSLEDVNISPRFQAMPDEFKDPDGVTAYRKYVLEGKKPEMLRWYSKDTPPF